MKPQHSENTIAVQLAQLKAWSVIFQVRHFHALQFGPPFLGPSFSRWPIFSAPNEICYRVLLLPQWVLPGMLGLSRVQKLCPGVQITLFSDINISQGRIVTHLRWGGLFYD